MKKVVVVDDRPWKLRDCIKELQDKGVTFHRTIYYPNNSLDQNTQNNMMDEYIKITGAEVVRVNNQKEFLDRMEELINDPDLIFLMDYDLKGDMSREDFYTRINVKYAMTRGTQKIWFYTSGPSDIKGMLIKTFPDHVISVPHNYNGQSSWDMEQVLSAVQAE